MVAAHLEILVEEKSMEVFLRGLLPRILPDGFELDQNCYVRPHNGKQDLQSKIPQTVKAYQRYPYPVLLMVLQDQDSSDCLLLKSKLKELVVNNNAQVSHLIRIVCRELENWYLGDFRAIETIYPESKASKLINKSKYRIPDKPHGSVELHKISKDFSKVGCARGIGKVIDIDQNASISFRQFVNGLHKLTHSIE